MLSVSLLVSGSLGFDLLKYCSKKNIQIKAVFTDAKSEAIIQFCQKEQLALFVGNPRKGRASSFLKDLYCDVLLSINYLFIVEKDVIQIAQKYAINFHGSLLPKYRGRTPHVWAIINGEEETGVTAHLMEEAVDYGAIVRQVKIKINKENTGACILEKFKQCYPQLLDQVLEDIEKNKVSLRFQDESQAFYVGKRGPEDGQINWAWKQERIYNWIRAQAKPYPGAFTFLDQEKLIIHKASFETAIVNGTQANGTILDFDKNYIVVKTVDGVLKLEDFELENKQVLQQGKVLQ